MATAKQQHNRKKFTKEYKVKEIQKNLTQKARLKKEYLKALKEEGYTVPEKNETGRSKEDFKRAREELRGKGQRKFDEKKEIKKDRKKQQREDIEARRNQELEHIQEVKNKMEERERRKKKFSKRTRTGQPLMGPKIDDLLSKIKEDDTYTR